MSEWAAAPTDPAPRALEPAPERLVVDGELLRGTWAGEVEDASFAALGPPYARGFLARKLVEKHWVALMLATPEAMLMLAIVDTGYLSSGICAVFDRGARKLLVDEGPVLPPGFAALSEAPGDGMRATLSGPGLNARIERSGGKVLATARWGRASIDLTLDARKAPKPMSVSSKLGDDRFSFTQKMVGLPASGELRVGPVSFRVEDVYAGLDFSHGYLARDTAWRWAFATGRAGGRDVGFNLTEGFMQDGLGENALWVNGAPAAVGPVSFAHDLSSPLEPWRVRSADGSLDLTFRPEGLRHKTVDLGLVASKYTQPFGVFSGHVTSARGERIQIDGLAGVAEDHVARW